MNALILIDIQHDFLPGGSLAVPRGDEIIDIVNRLQPKFDLVLATQDWHPADHKSFASQHEGRQIFEKIILNELEQVLWPDHCIQESHGAKLAKKLKTGNIEAIFRKGTDREIDSYSGFYDNGHLKSTGFAAYLKGRQITELYIAGLAGDFCVYFTAKDALAEGFKTCIIDDATRAIDANNYTLAKQDIMQSGGQVIHSSELL